MQGEKITVSSIQDNLRQELDNRYKNPKNSESASLFANFIYGIGKILRFLLMIILAVIAIAIALPLVGAFVLMFFLLVNGTAGVALFSLLNPFWAIILSALSVIIPLGFSLYVLIVILFSLKWSRIFIIAVLAVWAVIWAITGAFATRDILQYSVPRKIAEDITLEQAPDTLHLQPLITGENGSPLYIYNDDDLSFNNNFDNIRKNISFKIMLLSGGACIFICGFCMLFLQNLVLIQIFAVLSGIFYSMWFPFFFNLPSELKNSNPN